MCFLSTVSLIATVASSYHRGASVDGRVPPQREIRPTVRNHRRRSGVSAGTVPGGVPPLRETPDMLSVPKSSAGIGHGVITQFGISLHRREHLYCQPFPATSTKKWMTPLTLWPSGPQSAARLKSPWKFEARGHAWAQPEWNRADKHPRVPKCLKGTASDARPGYFVNHRGGNPNPPGQSPEESRRRGKLKTRF